MQNFIGYHFGPIWAIYRHVADISADLRDEYICYIAT